MHENKYMKVYKTSQYSDKIPVNKLVKDWGQLNKQLGSIAITGTNVNKSIMYNGKSIPIRPLLEKAIATIRTQLINNGVKEIDTSPLSPDQQGLAVSSEPGKIHVDVDKIANSFQNSEQPPITQNDGMELDPDTENHFTAMITRELLATIAHESAHSRDFKQQFDNYQKTPQQQGPRFDLVQEAPGPAYENQILQQYKFTSYYNLNKQI